MGVEMYFYCSEGEREVGKGMGGGKEEKNKVVKETNGKKKNMRGFRENSWDGYNPFKLFSLVISMDEIIGTETGEMFKVRWVKRKKKEMKMSVREARDGEKKRGEEGRGIDRELREEKIWLGCLVKIGG